MIPLPSTPSSSSITLWYCGKSEEKPPTCSYLPTNYAKDNNNRHNDPREAGRAGQAKCDKRAFQVKCDIIIFLIHCLWFFAELDLCKDLRNHVFNRPVLRFFSFSHKKNNEILVCIEMIFNGILGFFTPFTMWFHNVEYYLSSSVVQYKSIIPPVPMNLNFFLVGGSSKKIF